MSPNLSSPRKGAVNLSEIAWVPQVSILRPGKATSAKRRVLHIPTLRFRSAVLLSISFTLLALTACRPHNFPQFAPNYREYAYVTNGGSGTVSVYDVVNVRVDRELPVGQNPTAVTASATRNEVYVVNSGTRAGQGSVSVINAENNSVVGNIPVHKLPVALDLAPVGDLAYVANSASNTISIIDLKTRREVDQIGVGEEPIALRVALNGKAIVVANRAGNSVSIIDPATRKVRTVVEGCPAASDIVILPDSSKAFAACSGSHQVMSILLARAAGPEAATTTQDRLESLLDVGRGPVHLALKPDGGEVFVSNSLSNSISEVYASTDEVAGAYIMGADPVRSLVTPDNTLLYVANLHSQEVTVYSVEDGKRIDSIHVGDGPSALAFSTTGHLLFVVDARSGDVAVVRTDSRSLFTMLPAGRAPNAIAVKAFKAP
jgi:YVTN family beta-propeller protein